MMELMDISPISAATTAAIIVVFTMLLYSFKNRGLPPGPTGIPFLGYYPFLEDEMFHLQLQKLAEKYGDVFSFRVTGQLYIHINSLKALREAHIGKSEFFTRRLRNYNILKGCFDKGLVFLEGEPWRVIRKFFVQVLKEYGFTSFSGNLACPVLDSLAASIEDIRSFGGQPFDAVGLLTKHCTSTMRQLMFGSAPIAEEDLEALNKAYQLMLNPLRGKIVFLAGPLAEHVILRFTAGHREMLQGKKIMDDIVLRIIREHEATFSEDNPRDVIDCYIQERNLRARKNDPTSRYFTDEALLATIAQLVGDGALGVGFFIANFMEGLVTHPEIQDKIYSELLEVVGPDRLPTWEDKSKLPYTNAAILEMIRCSDFFSVFPSLECTTETTLKGYKIPKGSVTLVNNWSIQHDAELYEDPYTFDPQRYITKPGKPKAESPMLFGVGKRTCPGESFTMLQVFLFVATIVKHFRLTLAPGAKKTPEMEMKICAHPRI